MDETSPLRLNCHLFLAVVANWLTVGPGETVADENPALNRVLDDVRRLPPQGGGCCSAGWARGAFSQTEEDIDLFVTGWTGQVVTGHYSNLTTNVSRCLQPSQSQLLAWLTSVNHFTGRVLSRERIISSRVTTSPTVGASITDSPLCSRLQSASKSLESNPSLSGPLRCQGVEEVVESPEVGECLVGALLAPVGHQE